MRTHSSMVFKYPLLMKDSQIVEIPQALKILNVSVQDGQPVLYAMVWPDNIIETWEVRIAGTGHPIDFGWMPEHYIGTFKFENVYWFHVFARKIS